MANRIRGLAPAPAPAPAAASHPEAPPEAPPDHRGDVWSKIGWLQLFDRVIANLSSFLPTFVHSIQVAAAGGPNCDIRRLWYLVCAAGFGRLRNKIRTGLAFISMDATWDITGKVCSLEIAYQMNALSNVDGANANLGDPGASSLALMYRGPEQLTVGGDWGNAFAPLMTRLDGGIKIVPRPAPFWVARLTASGCVNENPNERVRVYSISTQIDAHGKSSPFMRPGFGNINPLRELPEGGSATTDGRKSFLNARSYPYRIVIPDGDPIQVHEAAGVGAGGSSLAALPDSGRIITTVEKNDVRIQPPKPPVDGHTRCGLLALVAQSLQTPCFLPGSPPCNRNPSAGAGVYAQPRGTPGTSHPFDLVSLWKVADGSVGAPWPLGPNVGADGYDLAGTTETNYAD